SPPRAMPGKKERAATGAAPVLGGKARRTYRPEADASGRGLQLCSTTEYVNKWLTPARRRASHAAMGVRRHRWARDRRRDATASLFRRRARVDLLRRFDHRDTGKTREPALTELFPCRRRTQ